MVMTDRETLKLALEALIDFGSHIENCPQFPTWAEPKKHPSCTCGYDTAITALRQALEQPECNKHPDAPHGFNRESSHSLGRYVCDCEGWEPEQKPVAWWNPRYGKGEYAFAEEQSPPDDSNDPSDFGWNIPLYTAPPKPIWVGLTDEEICAVDWKPNETLHDFVRAIEAKLKEKNRD